VSAMVFRIWECTFRASARVQAGALGDDDDVDEELSVKPSAAKVPGRGMFGIEE